MNVYSKLNKARLELQSTELTKSGHNKFAGYKYFELGDFLPTINKIFDNVGLCGVISFGSDLATLTIVSVDDGSKIEITSPMADAQLKGCHPIQNLGAVETYTRRYLWVTAMEIVEHDALDASQPVVDATVLVEAIGLCTDMEQLKTAFAQAYKVASKDKEALKLINDAKELKKKELS
jgi:hypothetical protein